MRLCGLRTQENLLVDAAEWPPVAVEQRAEPPPFGQERVGPDEMEILLRTGGGVRLEREPARVTFLLPRRVDDAALLHPYLAPAAALHAWWLGREALHAGGVIAGGGVWGVLGERGAGKSTALGWLAQAGRAVVADDVLVVEGATAYSGPRAVDLRRDAAQALQAGEPMGVLGRRERWRLRLGPAPPAAPLRGWVVLGWGDDVAVEPVPPADRLRLIAAQRMVRLPLRRPDALLQLARLPAWTWVRPRDWSRTREAAQRLLAVLER